MLVLSIQIKLPENLSQALSLKSIYLSGSGTTDLDDIRSIRIYYSGDSTQFFTGQAFGKGKKPQEGLIFEGNTQLTSGANIFWITAELDNDCSLDHRIRLECIAIQLSDGSLHYPKSSNSIASLRVGHTLTTERTRWDSYV